MKIRDWLPHRKGEGMEPASGWGNAGAEAVVRQRGCLTEKGSRKAVADWACGRSMHREMERMIIKMTDPTL